MGMDNDGRPDPDALLALARKEDADTRTGKLRLFFGAAPGVGKTYSMLEAAQAARGEGLDVVVGVVETHGRTETGDLLSGLAVLPRRRIAYKGHELAEFDLDAALARRPGLLLVDELAHTNAPGSRHAKRWQDVRELLAAGIDVYTTLNVQHIESINDVVAQITGVRVRETVPDTVLEEADAIVLVDLPVEDLLRRLREGKVYVPERAEWAAEHFFRSGNLFALRELALRFTAERISAEVLVYRKGHAIEATWPTAERLLVCVGPSPTSAKLIRAAKRASAARHVPWIAAFVESPRLSDAQRQSAAENLRLAEKLGAETATIAGPRVSEEIVALARSKNVSTIIIGKPVRPRWKDFLLGSPVDELVRKSGEIDVHVIRGDVGGEAERITAQPRRPVSWRPYAAGCGIWLAATVVSFAMFPDFQLSNLIMVYLLGVVVAAMTCGRGPSLLTAVASVLAFDFFFVPPRFTFAVSDTQYVVTFAIMLGVALVISRLTTRMRDHAALARDLERRAGLMLALSQRLAEARGVDVAAQTAERAVTELLDCDAAVLVPDANGSLRHSGKSFAAFLDAKGLGAAQWVFENGHAAGRGTDTLPDVPALFLPLAGRDRVMGVLVAAPASPKEIFPEQIRILDSFARQVGLALEVERLQESARLAQLESEAERLKASLLSAVTHDLQTPLAAISGSAESLLLPNAANDPHTHDMLAQNIRDEAARLSRLLDNLLRLTRLESGTVRLRKEPIPLEEIVGTALSRMERSLGGRPVAISLPEDLPMPPLDGLLMEQLLVNLLENVAKYTPAGSPVHIAAHKTGENVELIVADRGPGIPPDALERVFEIFYRAPGEKHPRGYGLGLAICRAVAVAHGGNIRAENRPKGGTRFIVTLPLEAAAPEHGDHGANADNDSGHRG
jgi:two-component system sensor histidine kinase KdpD